MCPVRFTGLLFTDPTIFEYNLLLNCKITYPGNAGGFILHREIFWCPQNYVADNLPLSLIGHQ